MLKVFWATIDKSKQVLAIKTIDSPKFLFPECGIRDKMLRPLLHYALGE